MASLRASQISGLINDLTKIGLISDATIKFIIDKTPLGNQNQASSSGEWIIVGRLLPNSDIYKQGSIEVHIILGPSFPLQPPNICLKTKVYHPNVNEKGEVSIDLLNSTVSWKPSTSLVSIVEKVTDIIDNPSTDLVQNIEAARYYDTNRGEYEKMAAATFNSNCAPRN